MKEDFLQKKLVERQEQHAYRSLKNAAGMIDFCSNDYLGIACNPSLTSVMPITLKHGSTGSRLLAGNYSLIEETEQFIASFHQAEAGLIFNSGYDANVGLLSCVPQRGDTILYDYLSHASIRDGVRLSFAESFSFLHNNLDNLEEKLKKSSGNRFVVTESVFSMDGDQGLLKEISLLCDRYEANLIVDEAHATGVMGINGGGLVQDCQLQANCFARIHTFGKAVGCHGAIVLGSQTLRNYLINFSRPFIYSTALPETSIQAIKSSYLLFPTMKKEREQLTRLITTFQTADLKFRKLKSSTPIQGIIVPGNQEAKAIAAQLQSNRLDVRPILYPTVPLNSERLRIILHAFNTMEEVNSLISLLQ
ncbi:MAG: aminotransferase class I/II-fold pyridoxal phosphate-dependent enzyme [Chitinophagaceae bacterium]